MRKMVLKNAVADDDGAASLVQKTPMHKSNKKNWDANINCNLWMCVLICVQ